MKELARNCDPPLFDLTADSTGDLLVRAQAGHVFKVNQWPSFSTTCTLGISPFIKTCFDISMTS